MQCDVNSANLQEKLIFESKSNNEIIILNNPNYLLPCPYRSTTRWVVDRTTTHDDLDLALGKSNDTITLLEYFLGAYLPTRKQTETQVSVNKSLTNALLVKCTICACSANS